MLLSTTNKFSRSETRGNGTAEMRLLFEDIAWAHNFDPLSAENWYSIPLKSIHDFNVRSYPRYFSLISCREQNS